MNGNLYSLFADRFARCRDDPAIETGKGRRYSFAELEAHAARYASLLADLGLVPGDRVAVQVEKSPQALFLYLACLRAGLVYLPLNNAYQEGEVTYFLENAEPRAVIAQPGSMPWLEPLARRCGIAHVFSMDEGGGGSFTEAAASASGKPGIAERAPEDLAAILYTSGTTGRSKGAMLTHRNLASNAVTLHRCWGFREGDVLVHMLPLFHVHGLFVACHTALLNGSMIRFHEKFDARRALADFAMSTVFMGVPTFYSRLLAESALNRDACSNMRLFISGSAPLNVDTFEAFRARTGHVILERYGMTETGMLTSNPLDGERRGGTVGLPLPGVQVRVADEANRPLPAGEVGNVQVKGDNVLCGYWRMPEKDREEFTEDRFFRTGDLGVFSADGYLSIVGRSKDLIITGGFNVYPKEIEIAIDALPGVLESAVVGVPHADFGEAVTAVVVPRKGAPAPSEGEVIAALKSKLANFKVPKRVVFLEELPRNTMGKVQKNELRKRLGGA
jgi:malonyl-CoA/methylmalonyl-CoA synthetase